MIVVKLISVVDVYKGSAKPKFHDKGNEKEVNFI